MKPANLEKDEISMATYKPRIDIIMDERNAVGKDKYARMYSFACENVSEISMRVHPTDIYILHMIYSSEHTSLAPGISKMDLGLSSEMYVA